MTLVGYFNSLRELGGMKRAVDDSINTRLRRMERAKRPRMANRISVPTALSELTSRRNATEIPKSLDQLEVPFDRAANETARRTKQAEVAGRCLAGDKHDFRRRRCPTVWPDGRGRSAQEHRRVHSGNQPRRPPPPGLVFVVYNWTRPRDISHYERFEHYHATFYQQVEALSITPFAPRALDRGLSAALVSAVRLSDFEFNANDAAAKVTKESELVQDALEELSARAGQVAGTRSSDLVRDALAKRMDDWANAISKTLGGSVLGYRERRDSQTVGLLRDPDNHRWTTFTCLNSMRNVEPTINLVLDEHGMDRDEDRPWSRPESANTDPENQA